MYMYMVHVYTQVFGGDDSDDEELPSAGLLTRQVSIITVLFMNDRTCFSECIVYCYTCSMMFYCCEVQLHGPCIIFCCV